MSGTKAKGGSKVEDTYSGEVTFPQLVRKLYPTMTSQQLQNLLEWGEMSSPKETGLKSESTLPPIEKIESLSRSKSLKKKKTGGQKEIPREGIEKMKRIFDMFDKQNKGCNFA